MELDGDADILKVKADVRSVYVIIGRTSTSAMSVIFLPPYDRALRF